jgi:hypothetical protein
MEFDVYTTAGSLSGSNINLERTDGQTVDVDISDITDWYDDYNID